ncbi:glycosyltransferase, partial [Gammaproteobacteria bacterium]|nr:glycosyltransferase [Gammaproteobacteria bacterium]
MIHYITVDGVENATVGSELRRMKKADIPFVLHSLRRPGDTFFTSEEVAQIDRETRVLYPLPKLNFIRSVLVAPFHFRGRFFDALANALFSRRESFAIRLKSLGHFLVACYWAGLLRSEQVDLVHAQWIHSSGTVGMYGAWLIGAPFGFTGHAADLFRDRMALRDKIERADYIICISYFHRDFYLIYGARPEQLRLGYCGIDLDRFSFREPHLNKNEIFTILSSGRLVEKKGFNYLIDACKLLEDRIDFKCIIAGSGELEDVLNRQIKEFGLGDRVIVTGKPLMQEEISDFMHSGDCYCLPCVWASDNDVDGLPQTLMEAMACGLPSVSTRLVGIPDLVIDNQTGILLEPDDAEAIAGAIRYLHDNREAA